MLVTKLISSLTKIFPDEVNGKEIEYATALKNEPFSFQVAFKNADSESNSIPIFVKIETDLDINCISEYKEGYVPLLRCVSQNADDYYDRKQPGLYPDMLLSRNTVSEIENDGFWTPRFYEQNEKNQLYSISEAYQGIWFTVNEKGIELNPGEYRISVIFCRSSDGAEVARNTLKLELIDACLPKQQLIYTCWFHCDCLADLYNVEMFSDRHFDIIKSYAEKAAETGMNMILMPAFTPPLDTPVGKERKTAQLVKVELSGGKYSFDFSLMEKYIRLMQECGITYFEHSHLFTQWGAQHAPKIIAEVDGEEKRIFGWDTDSKSEEYAEFLREYFRALLKFLDRVGVGKNIFFHISDEPTEKHIEHYRNALNVVKSEIKGYPSGDAISHYRFFDDGSVDTPIVAVNSNDIGKFIENCDNFWVYYCCETLYDGYSNRTIPCTGARNRILGTQMYYAGAKGFLNWGYNYYYDVLSHGLFNPSENPGGYGQEAGGSFVVYAGCDGKAIPSIRMKVFYEGLNDFRALCTLEELIGRKKTKEFVISFFGKMDFHTCPDNETLLCFREQINNLIKVNQNRI